MFPFSCRTPAPRHGAAEPLPYTPALLCASTICYNLLTISVQSLLLLHIAAELAEGLDNASVGYNIIVNLEEWE